MRARVFLFAGAIAALAFTCSSSLASADDGPSRRTRFRARLSGLNEVPARSTTGSGLVTLKIDEATETITFELSYADLEGATVGAAHVHLGQPGVNGGVMFFFCGGGSKPACPPAPAVVTGTVVASDIIGPAAQGIAPGEFDEVVAAIRSKVTYANVHTDLAPGGEIRGRLY
jgi:hypothetical protein